MARTKRKRFTKREIVFLIITICIAISAFLSVADDFGFPVSWNSIFRTLKGENATYVVAENESVHFIDVGQGDCALLLSGENAALIDCGENGEGETVIKYLKKLGIKKLDFIVLSHNDSDHIGGANEVIESIPTEKVYADQIPSVKGNKNYANVVSAAKNNNTQIISPTNLQEISLGNMVPTIYIPTINDKTDENENGIVVMADVAGKEVLFTGDIGKEAEEVLIENYPDLDCDILKVGHHGSKHSSSNQFLKTVTPEYSVISVGADNSYGHPTKDALTRLSKVNSEIYRTDILGDIVFLFDSNGNISLAS
ncbi:MAG: MBL fold metallo-hydrolase [Clostridia bacterium]|nr:MBL fold metallo-hydrolase [Clostridia bacterium]